MADEQKEQEVTKVARPRRRTAKKEAAQEWPGQLYESQGDYVAHGSPEHRAILGIDKLDPDDPNDAKRIAELEKALNAPFVGMSEKDTDRKSPIENRRPASRNHPGDDIIDGWRKRGR